MKDKDSENTIVYRDFHYEDGRKAGIKEVVEEIEKEFLLLTVISPALLEPIITVLRNVKSKWGINP